MATAVLPCVPGDLNQRHAATQALGKEVVDDGLADRARLANARFDVHQQAGAGVDFNDGTALLGQGFGNVETDQINPGDVQADNAGCQ